MSDLRTDPGGDRNQRERQKRVQEDDEPDPVFYECITCGHTVMTTDKTAGAFNIPPSITCVHDDGTEHPMDIINYGERSFGSEASDDA